MHSKKARATPKGMWNFLKKQMLSLLNAHYFQLLNLLTGSGTLADVSLGRLCVIPLCFLVTFFCIVAAYWAGYSGKSTTDMQYES